MRGNKNTYIIGALILIGISIVVLVGWLAQTNGYTQDQSAQRSALTASELLYDFGRISMANGKVNHIFTVSNPTATDITVVGLDTSCMCTTAYILDGNTKEGPFGMAGMNYLTRTKTTIKANGTMDIQVVYDPAAHGPAGVGLIDRFINLTEAGGSKLRLEIKAIVTP